MMKLDHLTEAASRWLASRTTRRSFIGNVGRAGLVVAGGSFIATTFSSRAEARVCGQSGISPKCPTFDCYAPSTWGWCWYAGDASCCADGGLKKICDCCRANHPNVHGYCPEGSNVYCVVESCLEDPRVMKVPLDRFAGASASDLSIQRTAGLAAGSVQTVVIADGDDAFAAAIALPVAAVTSAAVLAGLRTEFTAPLIAEIVRLGAKRVIVVGPGFSAANVQTLTSAIGGVEVLHLGTNPSIAGASIEVATWVIGATGSRAAVCVSASGPSSVSALSAATYAALYRIPLVVSGEAGVALRLEVPNVAITWVGDEVANLRTPAEPAVAGVDPQLVARSLAELRLKAEPNAKFTFALYPFDAPAAAVGLIQPGQIAIPHLTDRLDPPTRDWVIAQRGRFISAQISTALRWSFFERRIWELQSALNGFQEQLLVGDDGMGLPVITQPNEEREIGKARLSGPPSTTPAPPVVAKAKPKRKVVAKAAGKSTTTIPVAKKP